MKDLKQNKKQENNNVNCELKKNYCESSLNIKSHYSPGSNIKVLAFILFYF